MIRTHWATIVISLILMALPGAEESRTWTDSRGKQITAKFVGVTNGTVVLQQGRSRLQFPLRGLSQEDVRYLAERLAADLVYEEVFEPAPGGRSWSEAEFDSAAGPVVRLSTSDSRHSLSYQLAADAQIVKDGQPATLADFHQGDWVLVVSTAVPPTPQKLEGELHTLRSVPAPEVNRSWTIGTTTFEGRLIGLEGVSVKIFVDGKVPFVRTVPFASLGAPDREYLRARLEELGISDLMPVSKGTHLSDAPATTFALGGTKHWTRMWTDKNGQTMNALMTNIKDGKATFRLGGKTVRYPFEDLSIQDQDYVLKALTKGPTLSTLSYVLVEGSENWDPNIRKRIVSAMDFAVNLYNEVGRIDNIVLHVNYDPGVPTAQGNIDGYMTFGGQIGDRVALHEIGHCLGVGQHQKWGELMQNGDWKGPEATSQLRNFDGPNAVLHGDRQHFWPYGLNFDNEGGPENFRRHVLIVMALRHDMGL